MDFLASKNFSLLCAVINGVVAYQQFMSSNWLFGMLCAVFCVLCTRNYLRG